MNQGGETMRKISYFCPYSFNTFNGVLVKEENGLYYIADAFIASWLEALGKEEYIKQITHRSYLKDSEFYYQSTTFSLPLSDKQKERLLSFPLLSFSVREFHGIGLFFEHLFVSRIQGIDGLEKIVSIIEPMLEKQTISQLVSFVLSSILAEQKMQALFSSVLSPYLKEYRPCL